MTISQIINEVHQFSVSERIQLVDFILKSIWKETQPTTTISEAAKMLLWDYENDEELTAFTTLDYENFYETK
ncbi:MAG: hypothetical protein COZ18_11215 [Flexibacter sp. CG_4_10_14_3_um_filter_32_15]|nr:MAG: hypothetical protein COZ18_11215 [Flexibacter sp. CG_4_10_14_3_um_filter_32_15]